MERGIYFDAWHKNNHCYHPSLPYRSMQMIEDLEKYHATMLVWSAMGGGSISLPYLEQEAFGEIDPRLRFYGYMNDSEFCAECAKRGIKVFGIVFEVQGWEFPVVVSKDGKSFEAFNVLRDPEAPHDWYGLREFSNGKYADVFRTKLADYYPDGIINSDGELVTDLWEEVAARTYRGDPVHAQWVECPDNVHQAYQTCRNNPVWRNYLKKIIEIQIDAGVAGIQLDEAELPITSLKAGGCFCKDCRKQFTAFLKEERKAGRLDHRYDDLDLDHFDYKTFILENGYDFPDDPRGVPLFREYYEFQLRAVQKHFTELVDHAKAYGRSKGKDIQVSGNFFNCMPVYYPIENTVDVLITEMESTLFRQPYWYRYIAGFSGDKPIVVAENPYGGVIPELLQMLDKGQGYDLYRLLLLEASAYGCNMSVPYGGWMGSIIKDAFYPPRDVTEEVQSFLAEHEDFYSKRSGTGVMVMYSFPSYYWREVTKSYTGNVKRDDETSILFYNPTDIMDENTTRLPFWEIIKELADAQVVYDVKMFGDDDVRPDRYTLADVAQYECIIVPDCFYLTQNQTEVLEEFVRSGKKLVIFGRAADNIPGWAEKMKQYPNVIFCADQATKKASMEEFWKGFGPVYDGIWQVRTDNPGIGIHMQQLNGTVSVHLINYAYDAQTDCIAKLPQLGVSIRLPEGKTGAVVHTIDHSEVPFEANTQDGILHLTLHDVPLYAVIELV